MNCNKIQLLRKRVTAGVHTAKLLITLYLRKYKNTNNIFRKQFQCQKWMSNTDSVGINCESASAKMLRIYLIYSHDLRTFSTQNSVKKPRQALKLCAKFPFSCSMNTAY